MHRHLAHALGATALGMLLLQPVTTMADPPAQARNANSAQHYGHSSGGGRRDDDRRWNYDRHDRDAHRHATRRGYAVRYLPPRHRVVHYHGSPYYYSGGYWYRPCGRGYVVTDPPYRRW